ncbi:MAG TPA: energy transducer TonB [Bryobacteraceae bacterium]|nr:energy transducer TonB [Bryobacteraceae bacterium]
MQRGEKPWGSWTIQGYRIRPRSFVLSVLFHGIAITALCFIPIYIAIQPESNKPIFDELIRPEVHKIVWYDFRKKETPDVEAAKRVGTFPKPRGRELSPDTIIATSPKAASSKQFIWQPVPKIEIHHDVPAPNVVARMNTAVVAPPPEPKKEVKPEIEAPKAPVLNTSPQNPNGDLKRALEANQAINIPKPVKNFVPPPPRPTRQAHLTMPVPTGEVALPDASIVGSPTIQNPLPAGIGTASLSKGAAPPPNAPPGLSNSAGNAKADIAVASLHPGNGPVPEGSRGGQFSKAPNLGEPATGEVSGSGLSVPNLTMKEDRSKASAPPPLWKATIYADKVRSVSASTLSVPLRPASRTIPRAIEVRFQSRDVYTMVIPIENLPRYSGDWILWFAEREQRPGDRPSLRSPIPRRKIEPLEEALGGTRTEFRVQVAGLIRKDGKVEGLSLLRNTTPGMEQAVLQDISAWEFTPATRDGAPVDVDVVIEIPFSLPPQLARHDEKTTTTH